MHERLTILYDQNEKVPWSFAPDRFNVVKRHLKTGDYTLAGLEDRLCVERKSLGDFVGTVISDWLRFRRQLYRMAAMDLALIVVEAEVSAVYAHDYESDATPESVIGRAHACLIDHSVPVLWWGSRERCVALVSQLFTLAHKKLS